MNRRLFLAASVSGFGVLAAAGDSLSPVVSTQAGKVRGLNIGGIYSFRGIPYGAPAGGENRFQAPKPATPWSGTRDAIEWGHCAPQSNRPRGAKQHAFFAALEPDPSVTASEDCLNLNVWTASLKEKRPVMVWIHGGGYDQWSANARGYDGASLARHHDVVVVTVNHRLGVLGYLWLEGGVANPGQLDLVAALQWVRDNIAEFGGDPQRVMVFGQSGGARKISMLLGMPSAKGLFHAAAIESGATLTAMPRADAQRSTRVLLDRLKTAPDSLRQLPFERLISASSGVNLGPVVDGGVLPANPFDPVASPYSTDVPVIVGYTRTERTVYEIDDPGYGTLDDAGLRSRIRSLLGDATDHIIEIYSRRYPKATPYELAMDIATDAAAIPSIRLAERHPGPTYLYVFGWETPVMGLRSPHTLEVPFVFHNAARCSNMTGPITPTIRALEEVCAGAWAAFARTGDPNHRRMPHWPAYTSDHRATMLFGSRCQVEIDPTREVREVLESAKAV